MLLDLDNTGPRYQQLTRALVGAIRSGTLPPGARVPSSRALARQLRFARNVVLLAYEQLAAEGYLEMQPKRGTFVARQLSLRPTPPAPGSGSWHTLRSLTPGGRHVVDVSDRARAVTRRPGPVPIDFMYGLCRPDTRLVAHLRRSFARTLRDADSFLYGDPAGDQRLRDEVVIRLQGARGVTATRGQIVVTSGTQQALEICARLLLRPGDHVVVEDPGYEAARATFEAIGAKLIPVPVDDDGLDPARLPRRAERVRLVYLTPSHQFPTGVVLPATRRQALLRWAHAHRSFIIEDDYDGELRYGGQPIRALAGLDTGGAVLYVATFAKSLFPSIRLGYLCLPPALAAAAASTKWMADRGSSLLDQRLMADLMASGEYERHLKRVLRRYAARRDRLAEAIRHELGTAARISGDEAGLHLVVWLPSCSSSQVDAIVERCRARGVGVYSMARHALRPLPMGALMLGYGLVDDAQIDGGARTLGAVARDVLGLSRSARSPKA